MNKASIALVAVFIFLASTQSADAALLTFTKDGEVYWNVLPLSDDSEASAPAALEIKKIADNYVIDKNTSVALSNDNGSIFVSYGDSDKKVDVTEFKEDIIEIEEHDSPRKLFIEATESGFAIKQRGVTAETSFPISINSPENRISVRTATGERFLDILPFDAVSQIVNTNIISSVIGEGKISLMEDEEGEVTYLIEGQKDITLFNVLNFSVPIKVEISAISGKVMDIEAPLWYSVVDFLLV